MEAIDKLIIDTLTIKSDGESDRLLVDWDLRAGPVVRAGAGETLAPDLRGAVTGLSMDSGGGPGR